MYSFVQLVYLEDLVAIKTFSPRQSHSRGKRFIIMHFSYPFFAALFGWLLWRLAIIQWNCTLMSVPSPVLMRFGLPSVALQ